MDQQMSQQEKEQFEVSFLKEFPVYNFIKKPLRQAVRNNLNPPTDEIAVQFVTRRNLKEESIEIPMKINIGQSNSNIFHKNKGFLVGKKLEICYKQKRIQLAHLNLDKNEEEDILLQYLIKEPQNYITDLNISQVIQKKLQLSQYFIKDISKYYEVYTFLNPPEITYQIKETWPNLQENSQNQQFVVLQEFCKSKQNDNPSVLIEVTDQEKTTIWIVQYQTNQCFIFYQQIKVNDKQEWKELKYEKFILYNRLKYIQCYWKIEEALPHYKCLIEGDKFRTILPGHHYEVKGIWPQIKDNNQNKNKNKKNQNYGEILQNFCIVQQNQNPCILIEHFNPDKSSNWIIQYLTIQSFTCHQYIEDTWVDQKFESFFKNLINYRAGMWILEGEDMLYKLEKQVFNQIQNNQQFLVTKDSNLNYNVFVRANFQINLAQEEPQQMQQEQL